MSVRYTYVFFLNAYITDIRSQEIGVALFAGQT
jgi:hypothetical protein